MAAITETGVRESVRDAIERLDGRIEQAVEALRHGRETGAPGAWIAQLEENVLVLGDRRTLRAVEAVFGPVQILNSEPTTGAGTAHASKLGSD